MKNDKGRIVALDGLRGLACLSVVCFHLLNETFGRLVPIVSNPITNFLFDGPLAVCLFFIISGEAISSSFFNGGGVPALVRTAIKRLPRLSIPVFFASLFTLVICYENLIYSPLVRDTLQKADWRAFTSITNINLFDVFKFSFSGVYHRYKGDSLNPFLWTMRYELLGSILLISLLYSTKNKKFILPTFVLFLIISKKETIYHNYFILFIIGALFSFVRNKKSIDNMFSIKHPLYIFAIILFPFSIVFKNIYYLPELSIIKSIIIYFIIFFSHNMNKLLSNSIIQFFGKISFPLFLVQHQILISFECFLIFTYQINLHNPLVSIIIFVSSLFLCIFAAYIFYPTEKITNIFCKFLYSIFINSMASMKKLWPLIKLKY